jgi:hypothetical protein
MTFHVPPHDEPWERVMTRLDPDGYSVEIAQGLTPPQIEMVPSHLHGDTSVRFRACLSRCRLLVRVRSLLCVGRPAQWPYRPCSRILGPPLTAPATLLHQREPTPEHCESGSEHAPTVQPSWSCGQGYVTVRPWRRAGGWGYPIPPLDTGDDSDMRNLRQR